MGNTQLRLHSKNGLGRDISGKQLPDHLSDSRGKCQIVVAAGFTLSNAVLITYGKLHKNPAFRVCGKIIESLSHDGR